jgi:hypothetical protein
MKNTEFGDLIVTAKYKDPDRQNHYQGWFVCVKN